MGSVGPWGVPLGGWQAVPLGNKHQCLACDRVGADYDRELSHAMRKILHDIKELSRALRELSHVIRELSHVMRELSLAMRE